MESNIPALAGKFSSLKEINKKRKFLIIFISLYGHLIIGNRPLLIVEWKNQFAHKNICRRIGRKNQQKKNILLRDRSWPKRFSLFIYPET